jgi:hypothetical protein
MAITSGQKRRYEAQENLSGTMRILLVGDRSAIATTQSGSICVI